MKLGWELLSPQGHGCVWPSIYDLKTLQNLRQLSLWTKYLQLPEPVLG